MMARGMVPPSTGNPNSVPPPRNSRSRLTAASSIVKLRPVMTQSSSRNRVPCVRLAPPAAPAPDS